MKRTNAGVLAMLLALSVGEPVAAHDVNHQGRPPLPTDAAEIPVKIVDRPVVDQDGVRASFAKTSVGRHLVVVNFIYTSCSTLCPLQSAILASLQDRLGDRLGRDVALLSITIDPAVDVPSRLHEQAERFGAKPGWRFLTGKPKDIEVILTGLQAWVETPEDHPGFFLVGSAEQRNWSKLDALASPDQLMQKIDDAGRLHLGQR